MIEIHFTLHVANREAMRPPNERGDVEPWEWATTVLAVPQRDAWVGLRAHGGHRNICRARAGHADHLPGSDDGCEYTFIPQVSMPLLLNHLSAEDAETLGVQHESWMDDHATQVET